MLPLFSIMTLWSTWAGARSKIPVFVYPVSQTLAISCGVAALLFPPPYICSSSGPDGVRCEPQGPEGRRVGPPIPRRISGQLRTAPPPAPGAGHCCQGNPAPPLQFEPPPRTGQIKLGFPNLTLVG